MSIYYNLCEAIRMEVSSLPVVRNAIAVTGRVDGYTLPGHNTKAGQVLGDSVRSIAKLLQAIPGMTLMLDTVTRSYALDLLASDLKQDPHNPLLLVHTAEAQQRVAQLYSIVRLARMVDLSSGTISEILRKVAAMGKPGGYGPGVKMACGAHALVLKRIQGAPSFEDHLVIARALILRGQPGNAAWYAQAAARCADQELARSGFDWDALGFWEKAGHRTVRAGARYEARVEGEISGATSDGAPEGADPQFLWQLRKGAALMTMARANLAAGRLPQACELARQAASRTEFTCAKEVLAEARPAGRWVADGVSARSEMMDGITALDRIYYYGHWNGSLRIAGGVVVAIHHPGSVSSVATWAVVGL